MKKLFSVLLGVVFSAAAAEKTIWYHDDFEGQNNMQFRGCSDPAIWYEGIAVREGYIKIHREALTTINEYKAHGDVQSFALDVTVDKSKGRWGARAMWATKTKLNIPLDKPVWFTGFIYPEQLPPELRIEIGIIFNGKKNGASVQGGMMGFKHSGVDAQGWMVYQKDVANFLKESGFSECVMTGWQIMICSHSGQAFKGQRVKLFLDDVTLSSEPQQIGLVPGRETHINITPGPHTVGYASLYDHYPKDALNRVQNSSFENGFDRWYTTVSFSGTEKKDLHLSDPASVFLIRKGDAPHGEHYAELNHPGKKPSSATISSMPVQIKEGNPYTLSFCAKASRNGEILLFNHYQKIRLTTEWKRYSIFFPAIKSHSTAQKKWPGRYKITFTHSGTESILLDAVQLAEGRNSNYQYPDMVSLAVRPGNHLGLYLPGEKICFRTSLFNGSAEGKTVHLKWRILDFAHRTIQEQEQTLPLKSGECRELMTELPDGYRHYKIMASLSAPGVPNQNSTTAVSVVDDLSRNPHRDYFGQLGFASPNPGNFKDILELNRLLGIRWMLIYNNTRLDWEPDWREKNGLWRQRAFTLDQVLKNGFIPLYSIYPFSRKVKRDSSGAEILTEADIREIGEWAGSIAKYYAGQIRHFEVFSEYMTGSLSPRANNILRILPVIYKALKQGNPECEVSAFGENNMPGVCAELEAHFKLGSLNFCDAVTLHPYWVAQQDQELLKKYLNDVRSLINRYEGKKRNIPFWGSEAGHRSVDTLYYDDIEPESMYYPIHCTELEQAERTVRENIIAMGSGLKRYIAFYTIPSYSSFFSFSYVQLENGIRPKTVFPAYNFMVKQLAGAKLEKDFSKPESKFNAFLFSKGKETCAVMWYSAEDHSAAKFRLNLAPELLKAWNLVGEPFALPGGSTLTIDLDGKPVYFSTSRISVQEFARALASIQTDRVILKTELKNRNEMKLSLTGGIVKQRGTLTVNGRQREFILEPEETFSCCIPYADAGNQFKIQWNDKNGILEKKYFFIPLVPSKGFSWDEDFSDFQHCPPLKLGSENRVSRFPEISYGGSNDLSAEIRMMYDRTNLYLGIKVLDNIHSTPFSSKNKPQFLWANDAIQLAFDNRRFPGFIEFSLSGTPYGPEIFVSPFRDVEKKDIKFKVIRRDAFTTYKIKIPWKALWKNDISSDFPEIRFNIAIVDNDGDPKRTFSQPYIGDKQALQLTPGLFSGGKTSESFAWLLLK